MTTSVFISYPHEDSAWVRDFAQALAEKGLSAWYDQQIAAGESIRDAIETAMRNSDIVVLLVNSEMTGQPYLFFEFGAALGMGKRLVPIVPADMEAGRLPLPLRMRKYIVKMSPQETAAELVAELAMATREQAVTRSAA